MTVVDTVKDVRDEKRAPRAVASESLTSLFMERYRELLEGMPEGEPTWVTNGGPEGGIYGTLESLSAEQASTEIDGTTAAAHAEHVRWALQLVNDYFAGTEPSGGWSESWLVSRVDPAGWNALRTRLRAAGEQLLANVRDSQQWGDEMSINGALASYGHTAYHLGALRQLQKRLE